MSGVCLAHTWSRMPSPSRFLAATTALLPVIAAQGFQLVPTSAAIGGIPLSIEDYTKEIIRLYQDEYGEAELAAILGIGRKALWERRHRWGLFRQRDRSAPGSEAAAVNDDGRAGRVREL